jgi:hypothetical protein
MLIGKLYSIRTGLLLTMAGIQFGDNFKTRSFFSGTITYIAKNAKVRKTSVFSIVNLSVLFLQFIFEASSEILKF